MRKLKVREPGQERFWQTVEFGPKKLNKRVTRNQIIRLMPVGEVVKVRLRRRLPYANFRRDADGLIWYYKNRAWVEVDIAYIVDTINRYLTGSKSAKKHRKSNRKNLSAADVSRRLKYDYKWRSIKPFEDGLLIRSLRTKEGKEAYIVDLAWALGHKYHISDRPRGANNYLITAFSGPRVLR